jgi:hypothetical protein
VVKHEGDKTKGMIATGKNTTIVRNQQNSGSVGQINRLPSNSQEFISLTENNDTSPVLLKKKGVVCYLDS